MFLKSLDRGVLFGVSSVAGVENVIKIKPPLAIADEQADKALDVLDAVLTEVEKK